MVFYFILSLFSLFFSYGVSATNPNSDYLQSWSKFENFTSSLVTNIATDLDYHLKNVLNHSNVSQECSNSLLKWVNNLKSTDPTAVKQFDSWGRIPSGLMSGGWIDHGGFHECLSLDNSQYCLLMAHLPLMNEHQIEGFDRPYNPAYFNFSTRLFQSVANYVHFFRYMNITSALCLPKGCSPTELTTLANETANNYLNTGLIVNVDLCQNRYEHVPVTWGQIISLAIIVSVIIITLIGTNWSTPGTFMYHFNFTNNCRKLFAPVISSNNNNNEIKKTYCLGTTLTYLNGLKAITMFFMIFVHLAITILHTNLKTSFTMYDLTRGPSIHIFFIGDYMTDTFLLITGFESTWTLLSRTYNQQSRSSAASAFRLFPYLILRWFRFVPSIIWTIVVSILVFSRHSQNLIGGPLWGHQRAAGSISKSCEDNWFYHVLFIAHFFDSADDFGYCLLPDWYLESDYLYHLALIPVIYACLRGKPRLSVYYALFMIIFGSITTCLIIELHGTHHTWLTTTFPNRAFFKYAAAIHGKPWSHLSSYFMGVLAAFFVNKIKPQFKQVTSTIIWISWFILWCILFSYDLAINKRSEPIGFGISLMFAGTAKIIWSLILIWFICCLHHGLISPKIDSFLSSYPLTVLSRISLSVLLVNLMIMTIRNATYQTTTHINWGEQTFSVGIPIYVTIYAVAFLFSILIEAPTRNIIKSMIDLDKNSSESKSSNHSEMNSPK
ncbi:uncharacterized protein LOC107365032 [Tetranychus urticae]|uniref:uncharacterized protein LOC107365032 n=1 Tax=Tetranychus urticae TaxID=32264 RepID=UPI00077BF881|nr:uncharacterized protein LOC107365032 [Tetranychus urticae]